jgi:hypothetical protein
VGAFAVEARQRFAVLATLRSAAAASNPDSLGEIQELEDACAVLASLDSTYERLTAPDQVGHLLLAQIGALASFLQQTPQDFMPR